MSKFGGIVVFTAVLVLALSGSAVAQGKFDTSSGALYGVAVTTSQTAVFAAFLSQSAPIPGAPAGIQTALSVSNVLAAPSGFTSDFLQVEGGDTAGTFELYLWNEDGQLYFWESSQPLGPGQTALVPLGAVLQDVGFPSDQPFLGYGWVVANFDAVAGSYNLFIPGVGFTQSFELLPGVGQGQTPVPGLPVVVQ